MSATLYRKLFEECMEGVIVGRPSTGEILDANAAAAAMLGYEPAVLRTMRREHLVDPRDRRVQWFIRDREATGRMAGELALKRADGQPVLVEYTSVIIDRDDRGPISYFLMRDVTARRELERELAELRLLLERRVFERTRELEMANEEQRAFSESVSHDLRSPVAVVGMLSTMLQQRLQGGDEARYARRIGEIAQHMNEIIDAMLRLASVSRHALEAADVDLEDMVRGIAADCAESTGRRIPVEVVSLARPRADPALLKVVLSNLIGNAWKFTQGVAEARVRIECRPVGRDAVAIRVEDNGAGFDPAYAHRLFGPFQRLHRQDQFPGLGIGLVTVRRIVQRHGGRVLAEGRPGEGASFTVILPRGGPDIAFACRTCVTRDCLGSDGCANSHAPLFCPAPPAQGHAAGARHEKGHAEGAMG